MDEAQRKAGEDNHRQCTRWISLIVIPASLWLLEFRVKNYSLAGSPLQTRRELHKLSYDDRATINQLQPQPEGTGTGTGTNAAGNKVRRRYIQGGSACTSTRTQNTNSDTGLQMSDDIYPYADLL
jgi:hypothetical protein